MALDNKEVAKIAHLARLNIADKSEQEITAMAEGLNKIFDWVSQMQEVDTDNINAMSHPMDTTQRLRQDEITEADQHVELQKIAPQTEADLYLVPAVIE